MPIARTQWLLRLMVLVMAFTGPLQAFASILQTEMPVCGASSGQAMEHGDHSMNVAAADHCAHMADGATVNSSDTHEHCGPSCMGTCGACAHCPAGITQFPSAVEAPPQLLTPAVQHRPGDVPPETNLRPPRSFS